MLKKCICYTAFLSVLHIILLSVIGSQASALPDAPELRTVKCADIKTLEQKSLSLEEKLLVERVRTDFLSAIESLFGTKYSHEIGKRTKDGVAFPRAVSETLGKEFVPLAFRIMEHLDDETSKQYAVTGDTWHTAETAHFIFHYLPGTPGAFDLEILKKLFEDVYDQVSRVLGYKISDAGIQFHKIRVFLFLSREHAEQQGVYLSGRAATHLDVNGTPRRIQADLEFIYSSSIQSFPIVHEVTHLVEIRKRAQHEDPRALDNWINRIKILQKLGTGGSTFLGEGLAEYMTHCLSPLARAGMYPSSDALVQDLIRKGEYIPLADLMFHLPPATLHRHAFTIYPEAGSFVSFLVRTYGMESFMRLLNTNKLHEETFQKIYARSLKELEKEWLKGL